MEGKVLRRGEHDVGAAFGQAGHDALAICGIGGTGYHLAMHPEGTQGPVQVEGLVGHKGAQGVHEQAGLALGQRQLGGMQMEDERLAAARAHDGQGGSPLVKKIEHLRLRVVQLPLPQEGRNHVGPEARRVGLGALLPKGALLVGGNQALGVFPLRLVVLVVGNQARDEFLVLAQAFLERGTGTKRLQAGNHRLDRAAALPRVYLQLEHRIERAPAVQKARNVRAMEHDAGKRADAVGEGARKMGLVGAHRPTARNHHAVRKEMGAGVFLPEGGQQVQLAHVVDGKLRQVDGGIHLDAGDEVLGRKLVHVGAQALRELGELFGRKGDAHRRMVPAEAREDVLARGNGLEQVHIAHAAAGAVRLFPFNGEQDGGNAVAVGKARGHDALHALVPTLAGNHQRALAGEHLLGLLGGNLRKLGLDGAALGVHFLQLARKMAGLGEIVAKQQVKRQLGIPHAPRRVEARDDGEAQGGRGDGLVVEARFLQQGGDTGARILVEHAHAAVHQRAVLAAHGHEVGNCAERGQVNQIQPHVRQAEAASNRLHHLQGNAGAGQNGAGVVAAFRVDDGNPLRHQVGRLVVVGYHHVHAVRLQDLYLVLGGDAVVHRYQQVGLALQGTIDGGLRQAVALLEAQGNEGRHPCPAGPQALGHKRGGGNAVEVEVAEHQDVLFGLDGVLDAVHRRIHALYLVRVEPVPLKGRVQELPGLLDRIDAPGNQDGGDEVGKPQIGSKPTGRSRIGRSDVDARTHSNTYLLLLSSRYCKG